MENMDQDYEKSFNQSIRISGQLGRTQTEVHRRPTSQDDRAPHISKLLCLKGNNLVISLCDYSLFSIFISDAGFKLKS